MNLMLTRKMDYLACLIGCLALGLAYYLEIYLGLAPCPLCIIQRIILSILILLFLLGGLLPLLGFARRLYHLPVLIVASLGIAVAGRHVWLTTLPANKLPSCAASIDLLLKYLSFSKAIEFIFQGGDSCNEITWRLFKLSLPEWSLLFFSLLALIALWQIIYQDKIWIR